MPMNIPSDTRAAGSQPEVGKVVMAIIAVATIMAASTAALAGAAPFVGRDQQRTHRVHAPRSVRPNISDPYLKRLAGTWIVTGQLDSKPMTLALSANWPTSDRNALRLRLVSQQTDASGRPIYSASANLRRGRLAGKYNMTWNETFRGVQRSLTGGGEADERDQLYFGLTTRNGEGLTILLRLADVDDKDLVIDDKRNGWTERFATLVLKRPSR